jgi:hypothetical protein
VVFAMVHRNYRGEPASEPYPGEPHAA